MNEFLGQVADCTATAPVLPLTGRPPGQTAFLQGVLDTLGEAVVVTGTVSGKNTAGGVHFLFLENCTFRRP